MWVWMIQLLAIMDDNWQQQSSWMFFIFVRIGITYFKRSYVRYVRHVTSYGVGSEDTRCLVSRIPSRSSCALTRGVRASWTSSSSSVSRIRKLVAVRFSLDFHERVPMIESGFFGLFFPGLWLRVLRFFVKPKRSTSTTNIALRKNISFVSMRTKSIRGLNQRVWYEYRNLCWKWFGEEFFLSA
jgi:hypothetical protein